MQYDFSTHHPSSDVAKAGAGFVGKENLLQKLKIRHSQTSRSVVRSGMSTESPDPKPDVSLSLSEVPGESAEWEEIERFALTFNGYEYWGSFARCAEIADAGRTETLADLRTSLFFEQRRWRYYGEDPDAEAMAYFRGLLAQIRAKISGDPTGT